MERDRQEAGAGGDQPVKRRGFVRPPLSRRQVLKSVGAAGALLAERPGCAASPLRVAGQEIEIQIAPVSAITVRLTVLPIREGKLGTVPEDGALARKAWSPPAARWRGEERVRPIQAGDLIVTLTADPLTLAVETGEGRPVQRITIDKESATLSFPSGDAPLLGLGAGGPQFDRRGSTDRMRSGQGGYRLRTHGGRVPVPWLIGTAGWAMFIHQPSGTFDFTAPEFRFQPADPAAALPLDIFLVASLEPAAIMAEYARLTGHPEMPPLWSLGYQQSHRTLASREEVLAEAKTFREKRLPCDAMIYLGTGFCPSGWNVANGSFGWNRRVFPDPKQVIDELHAQNFKVVLHHVILARDLRGTVRDSCDVSRFDEEQAACHWDAHRKTFALGVDGWWPDEGDPLNIPARLVRNRMYWEGPQMDRPNQRPYALHRNGYAGMQRYASFLWSGDVHSTWETLKTHIPVAINTGLTGIPYWGTDIGGFVPTKELTGELYVRWFQFGAFNPLFRSHGRTWKLRLPWGWNTGDLGPNEITSYGDAANPDPSELHNSDVEPICRKYLELRYRMMPYLYSAVRESCRTGMPLIRALWLHYPGDPAAVARGDQYLWGRDLLVAPVVEKGATTRRLYLPAGDWYDFWTNERIAGGREITRPVDLATMPLYVRAGAVLPSGPVKQFTAEETDEPLTVTVYPGAGGACTVYEDDGISFNYRRGEWSGIRFDWNDRAGSLAVRLAEGSRRLPASRPIDLRVAPQMESRRLVFDGRPREIRLKP
ncbi:MAG: glycoside hydrolase family 31 protein [Acidobacteria bacterium]|nr:glycoside hydrolase family 31 protein [Acidobacteriota bacterium]